LAVARQELTIALLCDAGGLSEADALAGVDALDAVTIQLAIMYLVLGSVASSVTVIGLGLTRQLFTADHRLRRLERQT
jgi:ABC-type iron transport system FetAB permease component